jgi:hypothetical protein
MAGTHLFECPSCSSPNELSPKQAGQELPCSKCDAIFAAPKLGDLRKLPTKGPVDDGKTKAAYSPLQGWLFAGGLTLAMIAGVGGWQLYSYGDSLKSKIDIETEITQFNDWLDNQPPAQVYAESRISESQMGLEYEEPEYRRHDKQSSIIKNFSYGLFALSAIGLLMLIGSFLIKPKR